MSKKFKGIAKKLGKVATLGVDIKKVTGALSGGLVGENVYGDANPLNTLTGANVRAAAEEAARQQAALAAQQEVIRANAAALTANSTIENTANVVAGGSADVSAGSDAVLKRKRPTISSVLGV